MGPKSLKALEENLEEVQSLLFIHTYITGEKRGRRHELFSVLNRSGIVLLVACWEAFIEDLADTTFSALLTKAQMPSDFPKSIQKLVTTFVKEDKNELKMLGLSGDGWKTIFKEYRSEMIEKFLGRFNTPSAENVDKLFQELVGLSNLSKCWAWRRSVPSDARKKLDKLIKLRGDIAHRVKTRHTTQKGTVEDYLEFVVRLARCSDERVRKYLEKLERR